jgi:hypothetical protein
LSLNARYFLLGVNHLKAKKKISRKAFHLPRGVNHLIGKKISGDVINSDSRFFCKLFEIFRDMIRDFDGMYETLFEYAFNVVVLGNENDAELAGEVYTYRDLSMILPAVVAEQDINENQAKLVATMEFSVLLFEETFESLAELGMSAETTLEQYVFTRMEDAPTGDAAWEIVSMDGWCYVTYLNEANSTPMMEFGCFYKTETSFWSVDFLTSVEAYEELVDDFIAYAETVTFATAE